MTFQLLLKKIRRRLLVVCSVPFKLCNTIYYLLSDKDNVLVVNASVFQFLTLIRHFNIGDDLNVFLLRELTKKKIFIYNQFYHSDLINYMCIGSVLDWMADEHTIVWGAGIIEPSRFYEKNREKKVTLKNIASVRGEGTRESLLRVGIKCPKVYGDPALLLPLVFRPDTKKKEGRIGFIPHFYDKKDSNLLRLVKECGNDAIIISVQNYIDWKIFIEQVLSCDFIISSSLHGLIISDAYGVPNQWVSFSNRLRGGSFKFNDYYSAVGKEANVFIVDSKTSISEILEMKKSYKPIHFNSELLLKACPFDIVHPLNNNNLK